MKRLLVLVLALALIPILILAKEKDKKDTKEPAKLTAFQKLNYDKALEKAKSDKKIVMIDFYTTWCVYCKMLDEKTFSQEKVEKFLKDKTIAIKVDAEAEAKLAKKYNVDGFPTLVFIDGEGKEVGRLEGYLPPEEFLADAGKILSGKK